MDAVAGGQLNAVVEFPQAEAIAAVLADCVLTPSTDDDCDDLYGDVNLGFLPLLPLSPSPSSPPKTPSPGISISFSPSPSPPPRRSPTPQPQPEPQPKPPTTPLTAPKPPTPQHQPPLPAPKPPTPQHEPLLLAPKPPSPRHQRALLAPKPPTERHQPPHHRALGASLPTTTTALYIADLPWWTTDAEVEAALAPHGALQDLHFFADKFSGRSRGFCRADFLHPSAAASAAAALHGRAFHGYHCVASLSCPPALHRPGADFDGPAPNPCRGGNAKATARGNVGFLGDGQARLSITSRPRVFGAMGGGSPPVRQCNAGMGTDMMPSMVAPHLTPAFMAANRMAMSGTGTGVWHNQGVAGPGGLWGGQQQWNFGGYEMPWQQPRLQQHHRQQYRNGDYGKMSGTGRERPSGRNEDRDGGNVRGNTERRQFGRGDGERLRQHNRGEGNRHQEHVLEKERERDRNFDENDRRGGEKRRHSEYTEHDDWERRGRARSRSQSRDSDDDDYRRRRR
ncbi:AT-rich interactive domain-containing protein 1A [Brachypodium distachyon]|uniref:RRM domain-containing protein n=1 Tax=Brachypodium distachyon TaxID=15368 RepID=A0A0Q3E9K5_BRADI|nr:AT-rich interactive domain-containing protein 1A [Brachypodium distachyon]KQJ83076.2 hypothetical protein BRADI_5g12840v3 [Brachypodium distachyon]|eukprot:XP_014751151.1 AT-rich interactive domain-containing protein 1A [Brachypodium distachyon]